MHSVAAHFTLSYDPHLFKFPLFRYPPFAKPVSKRPL